MTDPLQSQITLHVGRTKWGEKKSYRLKPRRLSVLENDSLLTTLVKNKSSPSCGIENTLATKVDRAKMFSVPITENV